MLEFRGVGKRFGSTWALAEVSCSIASGRSVALTGYNGAGKTTFLRLAATLLSPTAGAIFVDGLDAAKDDSAVRARVGFVGDRPHLHEALTVRENLRFFARARGLSREQIDARVPELLGRLGLSVWQDERVGTLSRGNAQRASLANALLAQPALLLLDEPTANLDERGAALAWSLLEERRRDGATVVVATHDAPLAARCDRAWTLRSGRLNEALPARGPKTEAHAR